MVVALQVLSKLNKINYDEGLKVPYDTFYLPELTENVDIRVDYVKWLSEKDPSIVSIYRSFYVYCKMFSHCGILH